MTRVGRAGLVLGRVVDEARACRPSACGTRNFAMSGRDRLRHCGGAHGLVGTRSAAQVGDGAQAYPQLTLSTSDLGHGAVSAVGADGVGSVRRMGSRLRWCRRSEEMRPSRTVRTRAVRLARRRKKADGIWGLGPWRAEGGVGFACRWCLAMSPWTLIKMQWRVRR